MITMIEERAFLIANHSNHVKSRFRQKTKPMQIYQCVPNFSEGRRGEVVEAIADCHTRRTRRDPGRLLRRCRSQPLRDEHFGRRGRYP